MLVDLLGLKMNVEGVTFHLWSPWRCTALELRLFDAIKQVPGLIPDNPPDELCLSVKSDKQWDKAQEQLNRVLKGWQEEASDAGLERRTWRWLIEADTDSDGYDLHGEKSCFWAYLRVALERGGPGDGDKTEDVDFSGFGISFWNDRGEE
jgi:hypothetical protein